MPPSGRPTATRRRASRNVVLTATFLALAAGGTAACDPAPEPDPQPDAWDPPTSVAQPAARVGDEDDDEVFYCADEDGVVVDAAKCDRSGSHFFLWHSAGYPRGLKAGRRLRGGEHFAAGDRGARRAFRLPATGRVANGTVKTNVVGRGSTSRSDTGQSNTGQSNTGQSNTGQSNTGRSGTNQGSTNQGSSGGSSGFTGDSGSSAGG